MLALAGHMAATPKAAPLNIKATTIEDTSGRVTVKFVKDTEERTVVLNRDRNIVPDQLKERVSTPLPRRGHPTTTRACLCVPAGPGRCPLVSCAP